MNNDLRLSPQQTLVTGTSVGGQITPPADFRQVQALIVSLDGVERELYPVPPIQDTNANLFVLPIGYTMVNGVINIVGAADTDYRLFYYGYIPSLSDATPQNWLILSQPQMYLYATLLEACIYLRDDQRTTLFGQGYTTALAAMRGNDDMLRYGPSPRPRVDFITP